MTRHRKARAVRSPTQTLKVEKGERIATPAAILVCFLVAGIAYLAFRVHSSRASGTIAAVPQLSGDSGNAASGADAFHPTIQNREPAPRPAPRGMVWIPGGEFSMGANNPPDMNNVGMNAMMDARPIHRVYVDGFYIDKTDVTNAQFAEFVKATGYVTIAERTPRAEDFPGAPPPESGRRGRCFFSA